MATQTTLLTLEHYAALPGDMRCALVDGELRELTFPNKRHSQLQIDSDSWMEGAPDLAIEIVSPSNRQSEMHEKVVGYLRAGATVVLVVNPVAREVDGYLPNQECLTGGLTGAIEAPGLLPGLKIDPSEIFD